MYQDRNANGGGLFNGASGGRGGVGPRATHSSSQKVIFGTNAYYGVFWTYQTYCASPPILSSHSRANRVGAYGGA